MVPTSLTILPEAIVTYTSFSDAPLACAIMLQNTQMMMMMVLTTYDRWSGGCYFGRHSNLQNFLRCAIGMYGRLQNTQMMILIDNLPIINVPVAAIYLLSFADAHTTSRQKKR